MIENPYEILGVEKNISDDDLKKAYKKLTFENHPDRHGDSKEATERFKKINQAYNKICEERQRNQNGPEEIFNDFESIENILERIRQRHIKEIDFVEQLSLKEVFYGKRIEKKFKNRCVYCHGFNTTKQFIRCSKCNGLGFEDEKIIHFDVPPNVAKNGMCFKHTTSGAIMQVNILLPEKYNKELFYTKGTLLEETYVDYPTLVLGGTTKVHQILADKEVTMKLPPGTKIGQKFNVGQGLYNQKQICSIQLKYVDYTEEEKELLQKLQRK